MKEEIGQVAKVEETEVHVRKLQQNGHLGRNDVNVKIQSHVCKWEFDYVGTGGHVGANARLAMVQLCFVDRSMSLSCAAVCRTLYLSRTDIESAAIVNHNAIKVPLRE